MSYDEIPTPIEDDPTLAFRKRDYLPRGYKRWNRYSGSHMGIKQYTKLMYNTIKSMPPELVQQRYDKLCEVDASLNKKIDQDKLALTISLFKSHLTQTNEISNNNPS